MNPHFSSAQKSLLARAQESLALGKDETALLLAQALLQSAPSYLEARQLARVAAAKCRIREKENKLTAFLKKWRAFFLLGKARFAMTKKNHPAALVILEKLVELTPTWLVTHRWMAQAALQHMPPLHDLALFAREEMLKIAPNNIAIHLELARSALLPKPDRKPNPIRALQAYHAILAINPDHLEAQAGMKNALAVMAIQNES